MSPSPCTVAISQALSCNAQAAWDALGSLISFDAAGNTLSGPVPSSWQQLSALSSFSIENNVGVCGELPLWPPGVASMAGNTNVGQSCWVTGMSSRRVAIIAGEMVYNVPVSVNCHMSLISVSCNSAMLLWGSPMQRCYILILPLAQEPLSRWGCWPQPQQ